MKRNISILLILFLFTACGTSTTTVILLPDHNGKTGTVIVKNQASTVELNKPYTYVSVRDKRAAIKVKTGSQNTAEGDHDFLFDVEPQQPTLFILYFQHNSTGLTDKSMKLIPKVLQNANDREYSEISIIGHTDTRGSSKHNVELSLRRARSVEKILMAHDKNLKNVIVQSFGEKDPLVATGDNISEVKNRRVEIMIR